jgi:hypothetical protein
MYMYKITIVTEYASSSDSDEELPLVVKITCLNGTPGDSEHKRPAQVQFRQVALYMYLLKIIFLFTVRKHFNLLLENH